MGQALHLRSDSTIYSAMLEAGAAVSHLLEAGRGIYLMAPDGAIEVNGIRAGDGDRVVVEGHGTLTICALDAMEIAFVDLPRA